MIKCPHCAEDILDGAIKCKHCREWLTDSQDRERIGKTTDIDKMELEKDDYYKAFKAKLKGITNTTQKKILIVAGTLMVITLLFPPYEIVLPQITLNLNWGFLFKPPYEYITIPNVDIDQTIYATVNIRMLLVEWLVLLVVIAIAWFVTKEKVQ